MSLYANDRKTRRKAEVVTVTKLIDEDQVLTDRPSNDGAVRAILVPPSALRDVIVSVLRSTSDIFQFELQLDTPLEPAAANNPMPRLWMGSDPSVLKNVDLTACVMVVPDQVTLLAYTRSLLGCDEAAALRQVASWFASWVAFGPNCDDRLSRFDLGADPKAGLARLLSGLSLDPDLVPAPVLADWCAAFGPIPPDTLPGSLPALAFYDPVLRVHARPAHWDRSLLFTANPEMQPCPPSIDVTGRQRMLVFGPYMMLPPGQWRLTLRVRISDEAALSPYLLQWGEGANLAEEYFQPTRAGLFRFTATQSWTEPSLIEFRLWLMEAAFHGELEFLDATVENLIVEQSAR